MNAPQARAGGRQHAGRRGRQRSRDAGCAGRPGACTAGGNHPAALRHGARGRRQAICASVADALAPSPCSARASLRSMPLRRQPQCPGQAADCPAWAPPDLRDVGAPSRVSLPRGTAQRARAVKPSTGPRQRLRNLFGSKPARRSKRHREREKAPRPEHGRRGAIAAQRPSPIQRSSQPAHPTCHESPREASPAAARAGRGVGARETAPGCGKGDRLRRGRTEGI